MDLGKFRRGEIIGDNNVLEYLLIIKGDKPITFIFLENNVQLLHKFIFGMITEKSVYRFEVEICPIFF